MAVFEYTALERSGKKVRGVIDADTPAAARRKLRDQDLYPTGVEGTTKKKTAKSGNKPIALFSGVPTRDIALMTRQLAVLLNAGMPLSEALTALLDQTQKQRLRDAIFDVRDRVMEGLRFADGLAAHPAIFSLIYVNMIRAGEASGSLDQVLLRLADILEHQSRTKNKIISTLAYPAFMVVFAISIISFLMLVIVPRITALFERQQQELPQLTKILIGTTDFIGSYWIFIIGSGVAILMLWRNWVNRPTGRLKWDELMLKVPLVGQLRLKLICARFARILGTMLESGLTMMKALDVVTTVVQNAYVEQALHEVKKGVRHGRDLAQPLKEAGLFPSMLIHMIELGQRSGEIENMLIKAADTYDDDVQTTIDMLVSLLEPIIIVIMGVFVGLLVLSILLPILNMSTNIG